MNHLETGVQAAAATADAAIPKPSSPSSNDGLVFNGTSWVNAKLVDANVSASAAIAYSKLQLAGSVINNDIAVGAAIAATKLNIPSKSWQTLKGDGTYGGLDFGTSFPGSPSDGDEYVYVADGTNGVYWHFKFRNSTSKWIFVGGAPLFAEVVTDEATTGTTYQALTTAGPALTLPFAGDFDVEIGCATYNVSGNSAMSYDIGGTGAVDADSIAFNAGGATVVTSGSRRRRKTGLSAVTLTAKYKSNPLGEHFLNRWMTVWPVQK
ncbi:MAG TPA: hypothetical protein VGH82_05430 [Gaiellaceae bacterium]|jgi:hypothetical protein